MRQLLEQQMVSRVSLEEDNTVTLYLKEPQGGQVCSPIRSATRTGSTRTLTTSLWNRSGRIITDYDYPQGWVPPYWMSFIPWIVILVVFGLLW